MNVRRYALTFAVAGLLAGSVTAAAEPVEGSAALSDHSARDTSVVRDHEKEMARAADGEEPEGIINWFSFDYGPNPKNPAHKNYPPPFAFAFLNFAVFAFILSKLLGPWLKNRVQSRHDDVKKELDEASRLRAEAEKMLAEYQARVAGADAEIAKLVSDLKAQAEAEKARIIAAAQADAERLKADAERRINAEIEFAATQLRQEVVEQAVLAAQKLLSQQTGPDDQRRMAERYVGDLEAPVKAATGSAS